MQLYSFISNEKGASKKQGGNKELNIELHIEKEKGAWQRGRVEKIFMFLRLENGEPYLHIQIPDDWKQSKTSVKNVLRFEPTNQIKE